MPRISICKAAWVRRTLLLLSWSTLAAAGTFPSAEPGPASARTGAQLSFPGFRPGQPLRLVVYGDSRFADPSLTTGTNPRVRKWLASRVAEEHPGVLLLTGDTPFHGASTDDWHNFREETAPWRDDHLLVLPTIGNHETYGGARQGIANYLENFPQLQGNRFYAAHLGSAEVISLDCSQPTDPASAQARWFAAQLDHMPSGVDFLFILYHMPWMADKQSQMFVNLPSKDALVFRGILESRLAHLKAKVLVFNGHIHNYERFERRGVEYVVTGGGGAEPYPILYRGAADLYRDPAFPVYNYVVLDVADHQLHGVMWKVKDPSADALQVEAKDQFFMTAVPGKRRKPATAAAHRARHNSTE